MVRRQGEFLWPVVEKRLVVRARSSDGFRRSIQQVPPEEIALAVVAFVRTCFSITKPDLVIGVARELGYDRTGPEVSAAIVDAVDRMIAERRIQNAAGHLRVAT
jgi:hypothetical protein